MTDNRQKQGNEGQRRDENRPGGNPAQRNPGQQGDRQRDQIPAHPPGGAHRKDEDRNMPGGEHREKDRNMPGGQGRSPGQGNLDPDRERSLDEEGLGSSGRKGERGFEPER